MGFGIQKSDLMLEVTRGQVDNENNSQITYKVGVYIYESESIAIRNGKISDYVSEHRNAMLEHGTGTGTRIGTGTGTGTKI